MLKILLTGAGGLLGFHCRALLQAKNGECEFHGEPHKYEIVLANTDAFERPDKLSKLVHSVDIIFHLAGINRATDDEVEHGNISIAQKLVQALNSVTSTEEKKSIHICYANSTHIDLDTPYGRGKSESASVLEKWCVENGGTFSNVILPHIFGEGGLPDYNSVTSTLCDRVARKVEPLINEGASVTLLHAGDVAEIMLDLGVKRANNIVRPEGKIVSVQDLYLLLLQFSEKIANGLFPDLSDVLTRQLFNTYRFSLFPNSHPVQFKLNQDARGTLYEVAKTEGQGQTFVSWTFQGIERGNHFHRRKVERFVVLQGNAEIRLRKLFSDEIHSFSVGGKNPVAIDIPTLYAHSIENVGSEPLLTLFWTHEIFDASDSDTFMHSVNLENSQVNE